MDDSECLNRFNLTGQNANYIFKNDNEVICSTAYPESTRLKYGEIKVHLADGRPSANSTISAELLNFVLARHIRVRLQGKSTILFKSLLKFNKSFSWKLCNRFKSQSLNS